MYYIMKLLKPYKGYSPGTMVLVQYPDNFSLRFGGIAEALKQAKQEDIDSGRYKKLN